MPSAERSVHCHSSQAATALLPDEGHESAYTVLQCVVTECIPDISIKVLQEGRKGNKKTGLFAWLRCRSLVVIAGPSRDS